MTHWLRQHFYNYGVLHGSIVIFCVHIILMLNCFVSDPSNGVIRKKVRKLLTKLTSKLDPTGFILDLLFERDIIDLDQKSSIEELAKKKDRSSKLLGYLFKSTSADAFVVFRESLRNDYPEFTNIIDNACKMGNKRNKLTNNYQLTN